MKNSIKDVSMMPTIAEVLKLAKISFNIEGLSIIYADHTTSRHINKIRKNRSIETIKVSAYAYRDGNCMICFRKKNGSDIAYGLNQLGYMYGSKMQNIYLTEIMDPWQVLNILNDKKFAVSDRIKGFSAIIKPKVVYKDSWVLLEVVKYNRVGYDNKPRSIRVIIYKMLNGKLHIIWDDYNHIPSATLVARFSKYADINDGNKEPFKKEVMNMIYSEIAKEEMLIAAGHGKNKEK